LDAEEAVAAEAQNDELWANLMGKLKIDPSSKDVARSCAYIIVGNEAPASVYVEGGGAALDLFLGGLRLLGPSTARARRRPA